MHIPYGKPQTMQSRNQKAGTEVTVTARVNISQKFRPARLGILIWLIEKKQTRCGTSRPCVRTNVSRVSELLSPVVYRY